jgi:HK97 gp10 family phage protein
MILQIAHDLWIKQIKVNVDEISRSVFMKIGDLLTNNSIAKQKAPKHGRVYRIQGREHIASAPGEAPAIRSGKLLSTTRYEIQGNDLVFGAGDGSMEYASYLETGTQKMEQRPYLMSTVNENIKNIEKEIDNQLKGVI